MPLEEILANVVRLLQAAEDNTDRDLVEQYRQLAETWIALGALTVDARD